MNPSPSNKNSNDSCDGVCSSCAEKEKCDDPKAQQNKINDRLSRIGYKIAIASGKGGVGKSTVTVNLAAALRSLGYKVGILDGDITGPDIPKLLGIEDQKLVAGPSGLEPADAGGIKAISMALLLKSRDSPVVWRGPMKMAALKQFIEEVNWGELDFLLVDLPPGTSDEPISIAQLIPGLDGAIVVTTPQEVALLDSRKAVNMFLMMNVPMLGIVENMSYIVCPDCGKHINVFGESHVDEVAAKHGLPVLAKCPIDPQLAALSDAGMIETYGGEYLEGAADACEKLLKK